MSEYAERANQLLQERKWKDAVEIISSTLNDDLFSDEEKPQMAYNLIVCHIKMRNPALSQGALNKYIGLLLPEDSAKLQEEIYKIPSKITANEVKGIAWFKSDTKLDDVIGSKKLKEEIYEKIINPIKNQDLYREHGAKLTEGFVLFGPPGGGKTHLVNAIGGETGVRMMIANVHQLISKYQGESSKNLHTIFQQARDGNPAIVFFDEIDSLATDRNSSNISSTGGEDRRIVDTLLTELDGAKKENLGLYVVGATNRPWDLDSAFMRPGRLNTFIYVPPPNTKERAEMFKYYITALNKTSPTVEKKINYRKLAYLTFGMTPASISKICDNAVKQTLNQISIAKKEFKLMKTKDFIKAIKKMEQGPIIREYTTAAARLKEMKPTERKQYGKQYEKDVKFFSKQGEQRRRLYQFLSLMV